MTTNKWESQQRTNHRGGKTRWKKDGKRTEPLLFGICVCIFMPTPGWHDCRCVHVCPGEGYKLAACWRVNCGVSLTWRTPPAEVRRCDAGFGEEEEEEFDNTCALPRYWSHRCRREPKSRCPSCHFSLQPKLLFSVIADTLQWFPLQTPTARQLQKFIKSQRGWSCSFLLHSLHRKTDARSLVLTQINMFIGNMPKLFAYVWCNTQKYCLLLVDMLWPPPTKCEEWFLTAHCRISDVRTS